MFIFAWITENYRQLDILTTNATILYGSSLIWWSAGDTVDADMLFLLLDFTTSFSETISSFAEVNHVLQNEIWVHPVPIIS